MAEVDECLNILPMVEVVVLKITVWTKASGKLTHVLVMMCIVHVHQNVYK